MNYYIKQYQSIIELDNQDVKNRLLNILYNDILFSHYIDNDIKLVLIKKLYSK